MAGFMHGEEWDGESGIWKFSNKPERPLVVRLQNPDLSN